MEYRPIEVKVMCAKDLKDVNIFSKMDVYVIGSVSGDPRSIQRTGVDKDGGVNPKWNFDMNFTVDESAARLNRLGLMFQIMSDRTLGDKEVGRVYVPFKDLFDSADSGDDSGEVSGKGQHVTYQVQTPNGKFKGEFEFSFRFGDIFTQSLHGRLNDLVLPFAGSVPMIGPGPGPGFEQTSISTPESETFGAGFLPEPFVEGNRCGEYACGFSYPPTPNSVTDFGFGCPGQASNGLGFSGQALSSYPPHRVRSGTALER